MLKELEEEKDSSISIIECFNERSTDQFNQILSRLNKGQSILWVVLLYLSTRHNDKQTPTPESSKFNILQASEHLNRIFFPVHFLYLTLFEICFPYYLSEMDQRSKGL